MPISITLLLELVIHGDGLLAQRNEPEDMACFGAVFLVEVVDDCGVWMDTLATAIPTRNNKNNKGEGRREKGTHA